MFKVISSVALSGIFLIGACGSETEIDSRQTNKTSAMRANGSCYEICDGVCSGDISSCTVSQDQAIVGCVVPSGNSCVVPISGGVCSVSTGTICQVTVSGDTTICQVNGGICSVHCHTVCPADGQEY